MGPCLVGIEDPQPFEEFILELTREFPFLIVTEKEKEEHELPRAV